MDAGARQATRLPCRGVGHPNNSRLIPALALSIGLRLRLGHINRTTLYIPSVSAASAFATAPIARSSRPETLAANAFLLRMHFGCRSLPAS